MFQLELFEKELYPEPEAAVLLGMGEEELRTLRCGTWDSPTPYKEHNGVVYYQREDLEAWAARITQRKSRD